MPDNLVGQRMRPFLRKDLFIVALRKRTCAQTEMFQGRGGLVGLRHFYKHFVKNTRKKVLQGNSCEFFLIDTFKTTF